MSFKTVIFVLIIFQLCFSGFSQVVTTPWIDISMEKERHVIIAEGTPELYNGHPTTVMLKDNKTIFCTWSYDHGGKVGFLSKSIDGGLTWEKQQIPADWGTMSNCPSIYLLEDSIGKERLMIFSGFPAMAQTYSEDHGKTWTPVKSLGINSGMPFTAIIRLKNGNYLAFYQKYESPLHPGTIWQIVSKDGGITWEEPLMVGKKDGLAPCEPCVFRSSDGSSLICFAREETRKGNSLMMFSRDEGKSWYEMRETTWGLTGDRHVAKYAPDGRLIAVFRDMAPNSPTKGHFIAWVGTSVDADVPYTGQYRIKLLHNFSGPDCGYPGLEILPDGTIVATTYVKYNPGNEKNSIVSVRFTLDEMDKKVRNIHK